MLHHPSSAASKGNARQRFPAAAVALGLAAAVLAVLSAEARTPESDRHIPQIVLGVVESFESDFYSSTLLPTLDAIEREFPDASIDVHRMSSLTLTDTIERLRPHLVIMPAADFGQIFEAIGAHPIATRKTVRTRSPLAAVGAAFIVRADRSDLTDLASLEGASAAATNPQAIDGWLAARMAIEEVGYDSLRFFKSVNFVSYAMPDVFESVLSGAIDVGLVPACALERYEAAGFIAPGRLRVAAEKAESDIRCRHSTALYPDLIAGVLPWTDPEISRRLTLALLSRPAEPDRNAWTGTSDLRGIQTLFRELRIGPWAYLASWRPADIWRRFKWEILAILGAAALLVLSEIRLTMLVEKRTAALRRAMAAQSELEAREARMRERIAALERMGAVSQLCAMIAHELKQPIGSVRNYMAIIRLRLEQLVNARPPEAADNKNPKPEHDPVLEKALSGAEREALRIAEIIDRVRGYAKKERRTTARVDLSAALDRAIAYAERGAERHGTHVEFRRSRPPEPPEAPLAIDGDSLEIELLMLNLLKNAAAAAAQSAPEETPLVKASLWRSAAQPSELAAGAQNDEEARGTLVLEVLDNGPALSKEAFERMKQVSESVKEDGLGLGLAIVRHIVDEHGARLEIQPQPPHGLAVRVYFDEAAGDGSSKTEENFQPS